MDTVKWTKKAKERLEYYIKEGDYSYSNLACILNDDGDVECNDFTKSSVRHFFDKNPELKEKKNNITNFEENEKEDIIMDEEQYKLFFKDKKEGETNWREWLEFLVENQKLHKKSSFSQDVANIEIKTDKPVGVVYSSDWHLGSESIEYNRFLEDMEFLLAHDNLKLALVGDLIDNFTQFKNVLAVTQQLISPKQQRRILESLIEELVEKDKLIISGYGNHDVEFDERIIGHSFVQDILSKSVPYFNGKGIMKLKVGDVEYTNLILHKTRYNSFIHALHGAKREYQLTFPADVVVCGDKHLSGFEEYIHYGMAKDAGMGFGGETFLIRLGTYKTDCGYSKRYWGKGNIRTDCVVYFPKDKMKKRFSTAEDAVIYMKGLETI